MFCHKCGAKLPEDAAFCQKCGAKQIPPTPESANTESSVPDGICCPKCKSQNLQTIVESNTQGTGGGYGAGKGCLGFLLLGPLGLLCGACGSKTKITTTNKTFLMCMSCGNKFREVNELIDEKSRISSIAFLAGPAIAVVGVLMMAGGEIGLGLAALAVGTVTVFYALSEKKASEDLRKNQYASDAYKESGK